jgi:hypothetical protein
MNKNSSIKPKSNKSKTKYLNQSSEIKFVDVINNTYVTTSAGIIVFLQPVPQGLSYSARVGNDIRNVQLEVRLYLYQIFTGGVTLSNTRILFFIDTQQVDSTSPALLDVIFPVGPTTLRNYPNRRRFKVFSEILIPLDVYNPQRQIVTKLPLSGITRYTNSVATSINKNGIYMMIVSDGGFLSAPVLDYSIRYKFTDD